MLHVAGEEQSCRPTSRIPSEGRRKEVDGAMKRAMIVSLALILVLSAVAMA